MPPPPRRRAPSPPENPCCIARSPSPRVAGHPRRRRPCSCRAPRSATSAPTAPRGRATPAGSASRRRPAAATPAEPRRRRRRVADGRGGERRRGEPQRRTATRAALPNNDGTITRAEVPMLAGLHASFLIAPAGASTTETVTMNTGGTAARRHGGLGLLRRADRRPHGGHHHGRARRASGSRRSSRTRRTRRSSPTRRRSSASTRRTAAALLLQGVVSPSNAPTAKENELTYTPAAEILAVPLQVGSTWTSTRRRSPGTARRSDAGVGREHVHREVRLERRRGGHAEGALRDVPRAPRADDADAHRRGGGADDADDDVRRRVLRPGRPAHVADDDAPTAAPGDAFTSASEARRLSP